MLTKMFEAGLCDTEIAERLRLSVRAVAIQRPKQGLLRRKIARVGGIKSYALGTLLAELRRRGWHVQITKRGQA
jgi:hypothetical protein